MKLSYIFLLITMLLFPQSTKTLYGQSESELRAKPPRLLDEAEIDEYRRIWGTPDGAFYLMERGGCEIRTYPDKRAYTIKLPGSRKLVSSERGNYYGVIRYDSFSPSALSVNEITVYGRAGDKQYTISDPGCTAFVISDGGPSIVGIAGAEGLAETRLKFFNQNGKLVGTSEVPDFSSPTFSEDGTSLYALSTGGLLVKFSNSGKRLREFGRCRKYYVALDGNVVATYSDSLLRIFTDSDTPIGLSVPGSGLREVAFAADGSRVALLSSYRLEIFDLGARELLGVYQLEDSTYQLLHLATNGDLSSVVCSAGNAGASPEIRHTVGKVLILDSSAAVIWEEELVYQEWSIRYPEVRMSRDGKLFSALTASGLRVYQL